MSKFKTGDKVRIVKASYDWYWYADFIGHLYTIKAQCTSGKDASYYVDERAEHTVLEKDIELELAVQESITTTIDAVTHLQSLLASYSDAQIVLSETGMFVKALGKTFLCENDEVLEEVCKAVSYLSNQETT